MSDLTDMYWHDRFAVSRKEFESAEIYSELVAEAARRGFRRISLSEQLHTNDTRAYSWRGGVWVRIDGEFVAG